MPLINATQYIFDVSNFRVCHIGGRLGGGKTMLAVQTAHDLIKRGHYRYLLTNTRCIWADDILSVKLSDQFEADSVMLMDEGGLFMGTGKDADEFIAFMRKMNLCLLIPSVQPPAAKVRYLQVQRLYTFEVVGVPLWVYERRIAYGGQREKSRFLWWRPFSTGPAGLYDTRDMPVDDAGVSDMLAYWKQQAVNVNKGKGGRSGDKDLVRAFIAAETGGLITNVQPDGDSTGDMLEAAEIIANANLDLSYALENVTPRRGRRKK